jgi:two-component system response regulator RegA
MLRTVVVVDDDEGVRQSLRRMLSSRGYSVLVAHDSASAMYAARRKRVDCAIVDQSFTQAGTDRSGLDLAKALRRENPDMRVIIFTGWGSTEAAHRAGLIGAAVYLTKPAGTEQIVAAIEGIGALGAPATQARLERVERDHILRVVASCDGNLTRAAKALGVTRETIRRKLGSP